MRVLICGSRGWRDRVPIRTLLKGLPAGSTVIHGGADGADFIANQEARRLDLQVVVVEADWKRYGKGAGPVRNQEMLDLKPTVVWAFRSYGKSRGTDDMVKRCEAAGIPVYVVSGGPRPAEPTLFGGGRPDPELNRPGDTT